MYISLKWVQNLIGINNIAISVLCEKLTLAGFEIEEIIKKPTIDDFDFILDVSITANRSDLFNIKSFVRELGSIFFNEALFFPLKEQELPFVKIQKLSFLNKDNVLTTHSWEHYLQKRNFYSNKIRKDVNSAFDGCYTFFSIESHSIKVQPSPQWVQKYLIASNVETSNNILDAINFITLETGYPFFAFDLNKLKGLLKTSTFCFRTRYATAEELFQIGSDKIIKLQPNNLLLDINNIPVSILGFVTLKEIEIDHNTENILFYGGLFDPIQIRKSSQLLGLRTNQSIYLEKNLNLNSLEQAFIRLSVLLRVQNIKLKNDNLPTIHYLNTGNKISFNNYVQNNRPRLELNYQEVNNLLGCSKFLTESKILNILKVLNFRILKETPDKCELFIPFARESDLEREIDLIEEIVRISGFTNFMSLLPNLEHIGKVSKLEKLKRILRKNLINLGLNEVLHYSISGIQSLEQVKLKNPIVLENSYFRISLLNQLIQKAGINKKQKNNAFEAFEIGRAYSISKEGYIKESELLSGIFGGRLLSGEWQEPEKPINWYQAKGLLMQIFIALDISVNWSRLDAKSTPLLHPGCSAQISINNKIIGNFGQIHPTIAKTYGLMDAIYLFEINLEVLESLWQQKHIYTYKPYSMYPVSSVDLACIKKDTISFKEVELKIYEVSGQLLESVSLFDYYQGSPIPQGYQSLGFKLKFRTFDRTLTHEEVDKIIKQISESLERSFDIQFRK